MIPGGHNKKDAQCIRYVNLKFTIIFIQTLYLLKLWNFKYFLIYNISQDFRFNDFGWVNRSITICPDMCVKTRITLFGDELSTYDAQY